MKTFLIALLLPITLAVGSSFFIWLTDLGLYGAVFLVAVSCIIPYIQYREWKKPGFKARISW